MRLKQDGTVAAPETQRHKSMTFVNAVRYAVEQGMLDSDPIANINWRIAKTVKQVDPRVVANPAQVRSLLCAVSYVGSSGGPADGGRSGCSPACTTPGCGQRRRSR
ncbi:hypothetical protein [Streptomyces spinoverrucosus]|uniref:hypothetical protein n=1 Tax=Streptomyces spinoverrucosus TaxID=284043 RepID=UPI001E46C095|nr:hypothetical protein [Streptomyces spinoverrucosus]